MNLSRLFSTCIAEKREKKRFPDFFPGRSRGILPVSISPLENDLPGKRYGFVKKINAGDAVPMLPVWIDPEWENHFLPSATEDALFNAVFAIRGEEFRNVKNRRTIRFESEGRAYFLKIHRGVGWREIFKCLSMGKRPVLGASNEFLAIRLLERLGVSTMKCRAFAERGKNPAKRESFIVTDELTGMTSLEDFCRNWKKDPPDSALKHRIGKKLAETCAAMHFAGMNHRDCYLCHFLLDDRELAENRIRLTVLDLHRAEIRKKIPRRMRVKDLAGIFFSAMDAGLVKNDLLRFVAEYRKHGTLDAHLWWDVRETALRLYRKEWKRDPEETWTL